MSPQHSSVDLIEQDVLTQARARQLAALLDWEQAPSDGHPFPAAWLWTLFQPAPSPAQTGVDGHPRTGGFLPDTGLPRRMWASSKLSQSGDFRVGETVTRRSTVAGLEHKSGRSGNLCFVQVEHRLESPGGGALEETQVLVYREASTGSYQHAPPDPGKMIREVDWQQEWLPDPVMLFRYSALTYNAHRIHYDLPYATDVEGYPGLVVHAPLMATVLMNAYLRRNPEAGFRSWEFRGLQPVFAGQRVLLCGKHADGMTHLWVMNEDHQPAFAIKVH